MTLPFVVCLMPTYNRFPERAWLIGEAVECFLRQTYPADRRLLVVLNDCPEQALDLPGAAVILDAGYIDGFLREDGDLSVVIVNTNRRLPTLGEKFNELVRIATLWAPRGETDILLCPFEDDDLSLPHRLSLSVERLGSADAFNPKAYWFVNKIGVGIYGGDEHSGPHFMVHEPRTATDGSSYGLEVWYAVQHEQRTGVAHNASIFRRSAWAKVGGYPLDCKQDMGLDRKFRDPRHGLRVVEGPLSPAESFYVYRWLVSDHHVSGHPDPERGYREYGARPVTPGRFEIAPSWREDYAAKFRALAEAP